MDWIVGYGPPADKFLEKVQRSLKGIDTYQALNERYAKEPKNVEVLYKLAEKDESRYSADLTKKAEDLYKEIVALDPEGKAGTTTLEYLKATVPYTQAAEYSLGRMVAFGRKPDPAPLRAFITKYPQSPLVKSAYDYLGNYYHYYAAQGDAAKFFDEYTAKYPQEASVLNSYVERIIKDKGPLDKGIELAEKTKEIAGYPQNPNYQENLAQIYVLKGDPAKADEEYGKDFIEGYVSNAVYALTGYANFWLEQGKNLDSVETAADLAVKMAPTSQWYTLQTAADIYMKLKKPDKALAVYGPGFLKKNMTDQSVLASYASFWSKQGEKQSGINLESASEAARKAVELTSDYFNNYTLANILYKLKKYQEALPCAEKAVELVESWAAKHPEFSTEKYKKLVKDIKDAIAKEKAPAAKK